MTFSTPPIQVLYFLYLTFFSLFFFLCINIHQEPYRFFVGGKTMDQKQVLERWLHQLKRNEISSDAIGLGPDKDVALRRIREELEKLEAMEKKQSASTK